MALIPVLTRDRATDEAAARALEPEHEVVPVASWTKFLWSVRERPVTCGVVDASALPRQRPELALLDLQRSFPSLATVLIVREQFDPSTMFRIGQAGIADLVLLPLGGMVRDVPAAVRHALGNGTDAIVMRVVSPSLGRREAVAVRLALLGVQLGWSADDVAGRALMTRAHLSVRLRARGLPSVGRLMTWGRILHASRWLTDPGRSAESVSRQLGYANGSVFRRALRSYLGLTPTRLIEGGGLRMALERFVQGCDLAVQPRALDPVA